MSIPNEAFRAGDVYIDYPFESVMFRCEKRSGKIYRRFYNTEAETEIAADSSLFSEARIAGQMIPAEQYRRRITISQAAQNLKRV